MQKQDTHTQHTQPVDSCTSPTMEEIMGDMPNFSTSSIKDLQKLVVGWADREFPTRNLNGCLIKLLEEIAELFADPSEEELADVLLLTLDLFHLTGIDPGKALVKKMRINEERTWVINEKTGIMRHVTPSETSSD